MKAALEDDFRDNYLSIQETIYKNPALRQRFAGLGEEYHSATVDMGEQWYRENGLRPWAFQKWVGGIIKYRRD